MLTSPKVSIVIPVYNGSNYLREAIDSALAQTYKNIEVIVVNDGSNDGGKTKEIALSYGNRIRYFEKENGGVSTALNLAILEMKGEYFSWLSHDDMYYPDKVQAQIDYINKNLKPNIIVYSDWDYIDSMSNFISAFKVEHCDPKYFRVHFACGGLIHGCALLIPCECFKRFGTFNPALRYAQDYDLWFRFTYGYEFHHISRCLIMSRCHPGQSSFNRNLVYIEECNNLHREFLKKISFDEIRSSWLQSPSSYAVHYSLMMLKCGNYLAAQYAIWRAIIFFVRCPRIDVFPEIASLITTLCKKILPSPLKMHLKSIFIRFGKKV